MLLETDFDPLLLTLVGVGILLAIAIVWYELRQVKKRKQAAASASGKVLVSEPQPMTEEEVNRRSARREATRTKTKGAVAPTAPVAAAPDPPPPAAKPAPAPPAAKAPPAPPAKKPAPPKPPAPAPAQKIPVGPPASQRPDAPVAPLVRDEVVSVEAPRTVSERGPEPIRFVDVPVDPDAPPIERPRTTRQTGVQILDSRLVHEDEEVEEEEEELQLEDDDGRSSDSSMRLAVPDAAPASTRKPTQSTAASGAFTPPEGFSDPRDLDDLADDSVPEIRAGVPALSARRPEVVDSGEWEEVEEEAGDEALELEEDDQPEVESDWDDDDDASEEEEDGWDEPAEPEKVSRALDPQAAWAAARKRYDEEDGDNRPVIDDEQIEFDDAGPQVEDSGTLPQTSEDDAFDLIKIARKSAQLRRVQAEEEARAAASSGDEIDESRYDLHRQNLRIVRREGVARIEEDDGSPLPEPEPEPDHAPAGGEDDADVSSDTPEEIEVTGGDEEVGDAGDDSVRVDRDSLRARIAPPPPPVVRDVSIRVKEEDDEGERDGGSRSRRR